MRWTRWRSKTGVATVLASVAVSGCAHDRDADSPPSSRADSYVAIPMSLRGQDTQFRIQLPQKDQTVVPGEFQAGEICYLKAGDFRIDCFKDGSSLNLGPNDSNDLLTDNPLWGLEPTHTDKPAAQAIHLYAVVALIGGSIDRLPGTLADYLQDPGMHQNEAIALAEMLLHQKSVEFQGFARGGNFVVTVELTDDGRDKLTDALDEAGEPGGTIRNASLDHSSP